MATALREQEAPAVRRRGSSSSPNRAISARYEAESTEIALLVFGMTVGTGRKSDA